MGTGMQEMVPIGSMMVQGTAPPPQVRALDRITRRLADAPTRPRRGATPAPERPRQMPSRDAGCAAGGELQKIIVRFIFGEWAFGDNRPRPAQWSEGAGGPVPAENLER
ncbi:hypothetical protein GCM10023335_42650 [Streptomyces siamensis]|uniref:Uncharacterized protein n=1 Tax=Streptomyces siamensis TaxID=1274986 RepID=A0ABP9J2D4_9ACTN